MTEPIRYASDEELSLAVAANLYDLFRAMAAVLPGSELQETAGLSRNLCFPMNPMFKGVWGTRLSPETAAAAIDESLAWFRERQAPFLFWWTGPGDDHDLGPALAARGMVATEGAGAPCMVADLAEMNEAALKQVPAGYTLEEVRDEAGLEAFCRVFVEAYGVPEWAGQAWAEATRAAGIGRTPWVLYLGRLDGEPVATNILYNGGGIASVYGVATLAAMRGKGIGGAITLAPLLAAREQGYRYAGLFSSELGVNAYARIGFRMTAGRINRWLWRADA